MTVGMLEILPLEKLVPATDNVRRRLGDVSGLATSIKEDGLLQALVVTPTGDGTYLIVCGHRRRAAAELARLAEVKCEVREFGSDTDRLIAMLAENGHGRSELSPIDEARGFETLVAAGLSQRKIADRCGCKQPMVAKRLSLLQLPEAAQEMVDAGEINIADALELTKVAKIEDGVGEVFKAMESEYWLDNDLPRAVEHVLAEHERAEKVKAIVAGLEAKGTKLIAWPSGGWYSHKSARRLDDYDFDVDKRKHASLDCHAASVNPHHCEVVLVCTKPSSHPQKKRTVHRLSPAQKKEAEEQKARLALFADATEARTAVIHATLAKRVLPKGVVEFLTSQLLEDQVYLSVIAPLACELLGVHVEPPKQKYLRADALPVLHDAAPKVGEAKVALAIALAIGEQALRDDPYPELDDPAVVRHYAFLEGLGYQRAEIEQPAAAS